MNRVKVCCRVDVRDRFGAWTAVIEDVGARGCRIVAAKAPRVGSALELTISSDIIPELLEVVAETAWVSDHRVGASFVAASTRPGALTPAAWVAKIVEHGKVLGPEPVGADAPRVVPVVRRPLAAPQPTHASRPAPEAGSRGDARESLRVIPRSG